MKIVNLENITIEDVQTNYIVIELDFDMPNLDDTLQKVDEYINNNFTYLLKEEVAKLSEEDKKRPVIIKANVNFFTKRVHEYDMLFVIQMLSSHINNILKTADERDREHRLGVPEEFKGLRDTAIHIMNYVNYKTCIDRFNYTIDFINQKATKKAKSYHFTFVPEEE